MGQFCITSSGEQSCDSLSLVCSSSGVSGTPEHRIPRYLEFPRLKYIITYFFPLCTVTTDIGQFSTDIEEHIVLPGGPFLHKVRWKHPSPKYNPVIFETP